MPCTLRLEESENVIERHEAEHASVIHCIDPRIRFMTAMAGAAVLAAGMNPHAAAAGLAAAVSLAALARLDGRIIVKRFLAVNAFMAVLLLTLPFGIPGGAVFSIGPLDYSAAGLRSAGMIIVKANAIVFLYTSLVSTMSVQTLGHTLAHLRVPGKLVLLYLLMVRYISTLNREYDQLRTAMRARCFVPRTDMHTMKSFGRLTATLFLKGFHRSHRVLSAMKCRCWRGEFWLYRHFHFSRRDLVFAMFSLIAIVIIGWRQLP